MDRNQGAHQMDQFPGGQEVLGILRAPSQAALRLEKGFHDQEAAGSEELEDPRQARPVEIVEAKDQIEGPGHGKWVFQIMLHPGNVEVAAGGLLFADAESSGVVIDGGHAGAELRGGQTVATGATSQVEHPCPRGNEGRVPGEPRTRAIDGRPNGSVLVRQTQMASLSASLPDLAGSRPDLLVVGAGITGAGVARDAAMRGMTVVVVDRGDCASGTSSRSSRLIHGGLRYLEQYHFGLVFEALAERRVLLRIAPHLVRPLAFAFPNHQTDRVPLWKLGAGLILYDLLALRGNVERHRLFGKRGFLRQEPAIRSQGLRGGALYWDAQCDDARLVTATLRSAVAHGARVAPYVAVQELMRDAGGRITGARCADQITGARADLTARALVNATGPWSDRLRRMEDPEAASILRPTKGVHIVVPRERIGHRHAITFTSPIDGRVMFIIPARRFSYVGTTDTDIRDVDAPLRTTTEDVHYLLRSVNALFPSAHLAEEDVRSTWAGLRPLIAGEPGTTASSVSREHKILRGSGGMVTVAGGKLTTYRRMAAEVVDEVVCDWPERAWRKHPPTDREPLPGGESAALGLFREEVVALGQDPDTAAHLVELYGSEAVAIARMAHGDSALAARVHPDHPTLAAEVLFLAQREMVRRLDDVLVRRMDLFFDTADRGAAAAEPVAALLGTALGWSDTRCREEVERYLDLIAPSDAP